VLEMEDFWAGGGGGVEAWGWGVGWVVLFSWGWVVGFLWWGGRVVWSWCIGGVCVFLGLLARLCTKSFRRARSPQSHSDWLGFCGGGGGGRVGRQDLCGGGWWGIDVSGGGVA